MDELTKEYLCSIINHLRDYCYSKNKEKGWHTDINTGKPLSRNTGELLMLCVSELGEALEGHRKNLMDTHLPNRKMFDTEIADCLIRIFDLCGAKEIPIGEVMTEKLEYNEKREDHNIENRRKENGKKY